MGSNAGAVPQGAQVVLVDEATMRRKARATWEEHKSLRDIPEAIACFKEFAAPQYNAPAMAMMCARRGYTRFTLSALV
eukprot:SAG11_NODE_3494_length_2413_cov_1.810285_6_plen_77_part_01